MAASIYASSSSSSTQQTILRPRKFSDHLINGVSSPFISIKKTIYVSPIRCRFNLPSRNFGYSSRRAGSMTGNLEAVSTGSPTSVPVRVAHELLLAGHRYLDVRTVEEFTAGHVPGAVNIPYMLRIGSGMTKNPDFLEQVSSLFGKDDEILVGCQSGKRSLMAANDLHSAGYSSIIDIAGGYSAWAQSELPTEM
ncbi:thiosulfate sulfurtransferase 16, chloroplastic-like [Beta vulgaris subsp. vulgaris]|uniref:thiosulfate sulfurtransferase 16, chloroplastic-like n=1 Tax=Beta vulgaris subsp. vulgaris TaxID=3555 RepID=UPI00254679ED|nr:thiosulfate sulfurtransferase 16, chloroplastic-like [Beta vulgaris subsp. vulgaris]